MIQANKEIYRISTEDYFYLTENFAFVDAQTRENYIKYLMYNKEKKLVDTVRKVMENELSEKERELAIDFWSNNLSAVDISRKHNISRSTFYRTIEAVKKKLDTSLKYVLIYSDSVKPPSKTEFLTEFNSFFHTEEQIEN